MIHTLDNLITSIVAFIGLNRKVFPASKGWIMLDVGRKIEQSLLVITMLRTNLVKKIQRTGRIQSAAIGFNEQ